MKTLVINYPMPDVLDTDLPQVLQASPISITWKAKDHSEALLATAFLLARGYTANFYAEQRKPTDIATQWHVKASFK